MSGKPTAEEGKYKDIPSILPLAPGGVYAVKWEQREKWAECIKTPDVPYAPPLGPPNPANPLCYFDVRAGGYYLGRVTFELKADTHPVTSENFVKLCEYKCYAGTMFKVFPGNWIRGGDFTDLDEVVYDAADPEFFDFANLLPDAAPGGQSIYVSESGPYFADESFDITHDKGPGILTMYNPGAPDCNGSQFMITFPNVRSEALDGTHVAFGQVIDGWNIIQALEQLGDARQEGDTFQRVTVEACGVLRQAGAAAAETVASAASGRANGVARSVAVGARGRGVARGGGEKTAKGRVGGVAAEMRRARGLRARGGRVAGVAARFAYA
jgi:peptidyl-prolyl isomerase F (cyclophilin D)